MTKVFENFNFESIIKNSAMEMYMLYDTLKLHELFVDGQYIIAKLGRIVLCVLFTRNTLCTFYSCYFHPLFPPGNSRYLLIDSAYLPSD